MSTNSQDQEIDLGQIGKGINSMLQGAIDSFFKFIFFLKKKLIVLIILGILGVIAAFLLGSKSYTHEVSVIPNFKSNEYVYTKIAQINTKLREKDRAFFSQIGIQNSDRIQKIEIEAYPALFPFVNDKENENNFELIKLMTEESGMDKIMNEESIGMNYYHHKITITTEGMLSKEAFITPLLKYLNTSTYFETQQKINLKNVQDKIVLNDSLIAQIDKIIGLLSSNSSNATVSISEKNSLPELVQKKDELIYANQFLLLKESNFDKIVKEESSVINIRKFDPLLLNPKVFLPLLLIFGYLLGYALFQAAKNRNEQ
jgi:hypothetical protein